MAAVLLPCYVEEWWEDKKLFALLSRVRGLKELDILINSYTRRDDQPQSVFCRRLEVLSGLSKFLTDFCSTEEQKTFMSVTLPFIAQSASMLDERVPDSGIPFLERQECTALVLGRKLILSLLSAAFLCCFPTSSPHNINFNQLFAVFNKENSEAQRKSQAEKLKCILCYFQRAAEAKCNLSGVITLRRQVIPNSELPTISDWLSIKFPLSPLLVNDDNTIENSGAHTLQVNFASKSVGGEVLAGGVGDEEIRFSISPELLISRLIMGDLDENEAIIVSGVERFANYNGCGSDFQFGGEFIDNTERDVFGNLLNSIVSIDASSFADNVQRQYQTGNILRDLNKSYVGFVCQQDRGDISTELLALGVKRGSLAFVEESYSDAEYSGGLTFSSKYGALGNVNISSSSLAPKITVASASMEIPIVGVPLSPIQEVSESSQMFDIASNIIKSSIKQATAESAQSDLAASILESGIKQATAESAQSDLAASILESGIKQATTESAQSDLAASILESGIKQATTESAQSDLAASILESGIKQATTESAQSDLAASILESGIKQATTESAQSDLASNILKSGIQLATTESAKSDAADSKVQKPSDGHVANESSTTVDEFASKMTNSLFSDAAVAKETVTMPTPEIAKDKTTKALVDDDVTSPDSSDVDHIASALSSSILKSSLQNQPPPSSSSLVEFQAVADKLAESIVSDVLSHDIPSSITPQLVTTQTNGQPTSGNKDKGNIEESLAENISRDILSGAVNQSGMTPSAINRPAIYIQVERRGSGESGRSSRSSSITGQTITLHEFTDDLVEGAVRDGIVIAQLTAQGRDVSPDPPPIEERDLSPEPNHRHDNQPSPFKHDQLQMEEFANIMTSQVIQDGLEQVRVDTISPPTLTSNNESPPKSFKQAPYLARQGLAISSSSSTSSHPQRRHAPEHNEETETEPVSNLLTTPSSSRMSYAWSTASTRDEDSRPVSPTELDRIALGLTSDPDEFTSLLSKVVIAEAIVKVTGEHSLRRQGVKEEGIAMTNTTSCSSSWIDTFLSGLGEAETPAVENLTASNWHKMRRLLLRPIATGNWGCGALKGDPQLKSMLQWAAASASGRPQIIYYTSKNEALKQLSEVAQQLRNKQWSIGQLCQALVEYSNSQLLQGNKEKDLFSALLKK